ncbi:hypothetical protein DH2020_043656 [Rehmannia glutinosa]|uniref:Reverse transcriptase domain-containing protein n=1 Tax=Rehmannia glutinosa TaxID=99300 RepID=A0ABR0UJ16_REHGL
METKLHTTKASRLRENVGFFNGFTVDSVGNSGGLALLWREEIDVSVKFLGRFCIDTIINSNGFLWRFTGFYVLHKDFYGSDHRAILLLTDCALASRMQAKRKNRSFYFEPIWMSADSFSDFLQNSWQVSKDLHDSFTERLKYCGNSLKSWSKSVFGDIQCRELKLHLERALLAEEHYWKQRSRADWLKFGDKNTTFFHRKASGRRRKNWISGIENDSGIWLTDDSSISKEIEAYFQNIFSSSKPSNHDMEVIVGAIKSRLSLDILDDLDSPFSEDEVKNALFSMGPNKAPGLDGFHPIFFQKNWDIVGKDLVEVVLGIVNGGNSVYSINATYIVLIPKISQPRKVSDFRLISLCNVSYKIVTKMLENRLKHVIPSLISDEQSAFVSRRLILDNILVAYETLQTIRCRTSGKSGLMGLKLDLSKAYDRVEWSFLIAIMKKMGFRQRWTNLIYDCISSARFTFKINGGVYGSVFPSRGIRPGCPLSPYLFLFCIEGLSAWLQQHECSKIIRGISVARGAPKISHLLFADDSIIFSKASLVDAHAIKYVLDHYAMASGQQINFAKSLVTFSPNVDSLTKEAICSTLGLSYSSSLFQKYLGLPAIVGRNKKQTFKAIKERVQCKLTSWKASIFSTGGREILIKAVAQATANYSMSIFRLPKSLCQELQAMVAKFWWGANESGKKIHWTRWEILSRPKYAGGLGFRHLEFFNQALLAKQAWRLMDNPSLLVSRVFGVKYFPDCSFLDAPLGRSPSYIWRSTTWGRDLLRSGLRWKVGNGRNIFIFEDSWLPRLNTFKPITPKIDGGPCLLCQWGITCQPLCLHCGASVESIEHALRDCKVVREVWNLSPLSSFIAKSLNVSFQDLCVGACINFKQEELEIFVLITWAIWCARNRGVFNKLWVEPEEILETASRTIFAYQTCNLEKRHIPTEHQVVRSFSWIRPNRGELKLNVDAAIRPGFSMIGVGAVIRDEEGRVIACLAKPVSGSFDPLHAEIIAIREGLEMVRDIGTSVHYVETDSKLAVELCNNPTSISGHESSFVVGDIQELLLSVGGNYKCSFIPRQCNNVAHVLSSLVFSRTPCFQGQYATLLWLKSAVLADMC